MGKQLTFCILIGLNNSIMIGCGIGNLCASYSTTCRRVHVLTWQGMHNMHRLGANELRLPLWAPLDPRGFATTGLQNWP